MNLLQKLIQLLLNLFDGNKQASVGGQAIAQPASNALVQVNTNIMLTLDQLRAIMPHCPLDKATAYLPFINDAMVEAQINTKQRIACFLGQLAEESGELRYFEELGSGHEYEGRKDLGNIQPGDGSKFKGRGPIQITGRYNYDKAGKALGLDLINNPDQVATPAVGFRTACWFWTTHNLNELADKGDVVGITHKINGGTLGLAAREAYTNKSLLVIT